MMRRRMAAILGTAAVAAVVATGFVHAQAQAPDGSATAPRHERRGPGGPGGMFGGPGGPGGFGRGPGGPLGLLRQLDLSEDQRAQVRQVMESHRAELQA